MSKPRLKQGMGTAEQLAACGFDRMKDAVSQLRRMADEMERKLASADKGVD